MIVRRSGRFASKYKTPSPAAEAENKWGSEGMAEQFAEELFPMIEYHLGG